MHLPHEQDGLQYSRTSVPGRPRSCGKQSAMPVLASVHRLGLVHSCSRVQRAHASTTRYAGAVRVQAGACHVLLLAPHTHVACRSGQRRSRSRYPASSRQAPGQSSRVEARTCSMESKQSRAKPRPWRTFALHQRYGCGHAQAALQQPADRVMSATGPPARATNACPQAHQSRHPLRSLRKPHAKPERMHAGYGQVAWQLDAHVRRHPRPPADSWGGDAP